MQPEEPAREENGGDRAADDRADARTHLASERKRLAPKEDRDVLQDAERAHDGTVDAAAQKRHDENRNGDKAERERGRHQLETGRPAEPAGCRTGKVEETRRDGKQKERRQEDANDTKLTHGRSS